MQDALKKLARYIKILGDANRLAIIRAIGRESLSVTEIMHATGLSQTLVSFHLRGLRSAGIVTTRREGPFIFNSLAAPELFDLLAELSQTAGLENYFSGPEVALKIAAQNVREL